MDELRLAIPDESLLDEIAAYRQAMLDADSSMDGCGPLKRMENPAVCPAAKVSVKSESEMFQ